MSSVFYSGYFADLSYLLPLLTAAAGGAVLASVAAFRRWRVGATLLTGALGFVVLAAFGVFTSPLTFGVPSGCCPGPRGCLTSQVGQLTLLGGSSAEVVAQVQVAPPGDRLSTVQHGTTAYAINHTAGSIRRIDGGTLSCRSIASILC